ncbi:MAG: hypothetical protein ACLTVA_13230, partial [Ruminococcus sp.]
MTSKKHKSIPASTANTDRKKKTRPQVLPTLRGEQSGYYQYQLDSNSHPNPLRKGEFCPFIVAHFRGSVKNRRNIYADLQNDGQERKEHQKRRSA